MSFNKDTAVEEARKDLAERLWIAEIYLGETSVEDAEFPDMSLGAPVEDEMSAQMISYGWRIRITAGAETYEYRADKYQLRLCGFDGTNHIIKS